MPADADGLTVAQLAAERRNLFEGGFHPPLVALDAGALEHNLATMRDWCERRGVLLAPHGKTTMAPQLFARQLEYGAWGITVANFAQLRVARAFGVRSFDQGLPEPHVVRHADGTRSPATGGRVSELNDQHAFLRLGPDTTAEVGDWVDCGLSHPCTVFDKWQLLPVVDGDTVVDLVRTWF